MRLLRPTLELRATPLQVFRFCRWLSTGPQACRELDNSSRRHGSRDGHRVLASGVQIADLIPRPPAINAAPRPDMNLPCTQNAKSAACEVLLPLEYSPTRTALYPQLFHPELSKPRAKPMHIICRQV